MKVVIIGGERVPYFLAKKLIMQGYNVYFVNKNRELCEEYSRTLNAEIIHGDGTAKSTLDQIEIEPDDIVVLLMERDRKNFFAARLVQEYYNVKNVVTLLNNTENEDLFEKYGIRTLKVTDLIMNYIEPLLFENEVIGELSENVEGKGATVIKVDIDWDSKISRKGIKELNVPEDVVIVGIIRANKYIIPRGDTIIEPGDKLIVICSEDKRESVQEFFSI
ncbi:MAG: potassium channel family protein [Fervidobacterium sp.]|jgi:trk system potassium uptake protein TrkA